VDDDLDEKELIENMQGNNGMKFNNTLNAASSLQGYNHFFIQGFQ